MHLHTCDERRCSPYSYRQSQNLNTYLHFTSFGINESAQANEIIPMVGIELSNLYIVDMMRVNGIPTERAWDRRPRYCLNAFEIIQCVHSNDQRICSIITAGEKEWTTPTRPFEKWLRNCIQHITIATKNKYVQVFICSNQRKHTYCIW